MSKTTVSLVLHHDTVPSKEFTSAIGLAPDESWDSGSRFVYLGKEKQRRSTRWAISEEVGSADDVSESIDRLMSRFPDPETRHVFALLPEGTSIGIVVAITTSDTIIGLGVNERQLQLFASIGAYLDVSIAVDVGTEHCGHES